METGIEIVIGVLLIVITGGVISLCATYWHIERKRQMEEMIMGKSIGDNKHEENENNDELFR